MKAALLSLFVLAPSVALAEAAPEKVERTKEVRKTAPTLLERIKKLLPRGWTIETRSLPEGVAGLALGPKTENGRAVVMVSVLENGTSDEALADGEARAWLVEDVEKSPSISEVEPIAGGVPGAAEFAAIAPVSGGEERLVRYLVASGKPSYLLTVVAPKSTFETTYRQVVDIATRLRQSTTKQ